MARIGVSERRIRAMMTPPAKLWNKKEGVSMMLISATTISPAELEAGVRALQAARDDHRGDRAQVLAALAAMGFEYRAAGLKR